MKKILSAVVAAVYFSVNCVLAHSTEANFWASRRAASQQVKGETAKLEEGDTVQRGNVLLAQLPMASPVDLARGKADTAQASADVARTPFSIGPKTGDWLGKMVSPYGSVRDVYLSPLKDAPFIVHIQDGHGIEEAQRNISSMIEIMGQEPKIQLVGLEAAWGPFSLQPYRDYPDANITKEIADFFLKKGLIAGPEYAGLTLSKSPDFFGAEDKTLYDANVLALKTAYKNKQTVQTQMGVVLNNVAALKSVLYSEQLKIFDAHFEGYHSEKEKLAVYVRYLVEINEVVRAVSSVPNLELLVRALDEEDRLNFKLVEKERRDLVEQLANKLNVQQMQDLVAKSVDYRAGRVGYGDYHSHLIDVCRQHGIGVGQWAHLNRYISYVMLADKIDKNGLLEEMDALDRSIPERLAKTAAEKKLVSVVYDLTLMAKLLRHEMAPTDWAAYEKRVGEIHRLGDRLNELDPTGKWESLSAKTLKPFEDFCRYATQRNNALTDNLLRRMGETQAKSAVLVAGGFHTEGLSALLRQKQVSYVVVTPKITEIPRDNKYLDLLASDPVPLEKQLAGDRIYLAKVVGMTEKSTAGLMAAIQQVAQLKKALVDMRNNYAITTDGAYPGAKVLFELSDGRKIYLVNNYKSEKTVFARFSELVSPLLVWAGRHSYAIKNVLIVVGMATMGLTFGNTSTDLLAAVFAGSVGPYVLNQSSGKMGDLTKAEIDLIQSVVDKTGVRLFVVGSAAKGQRRGVGTDLPFAGFGAEKKGTRSDIDYATVNGKEDLADLASLPDVDPNFGVRGLDYINLKNSPAIEFVPNGKPIFHQQENRRMTLTDLGKVTGKPAATIKALMPLYHWMGRTFNPEWSRIPAREKLEQIIEVYAPVVESVLFGFVFGGTLALLGFLGIDLSTLQTVGLWGAFNGIFALSHRTFYVLENGEWKEKSLADVGQSTHLTLWVASLGVHLPLLGMMITPAAFTVPFFLSGFISSVLGSGFHHFYNKWVAQPFGLPALTVGGNREFASQNNLAAMQNLSDYYSRLNKNTLPRILFVDQSGNLSRRVADHVRADLGKTNLPLEVGNISGFDLKAEGNKKIDFDMIVILNMGTQPPRVLSHWINQHKDSWSMAVQITLPESSSEEKTTLDVAEFSSTLVQVLSSSKSRTVVPSQSIKDIRALAGSIVDGFQNGRLNSFNDFFPGKSLSSIEDMLDSIARNVVKEKLKATSFRPLKDQPGKHMDVFEAVTLPGIIVKIPKPSYSIHDVEQYDMGELNRIRYGYSVTKKELGGLFAGQLLDNISFDLNGKTISPPFVIIQEKVTPLTEAFKNLDPNNARDVSDRERINTLLNETLEKMWMRGVVDIDFHNTANNYGLTRSGNIVGFDVDKIRYIADVESGLVSDVPVLKDLYTRVFGKYHEGKQQAVKGIRVHDVFESDVRQAQEAWLIEYLQKQPSQTRSKGVNNFAYYVFLSFGASKEFASKWGMRLLPLEISVLGWAGWMASGWAQTLVGGIIALDPTLMGAVLMGAGILVFRGLHFALDKVWARTHPAQGPPSTTFWLNTARMLPYAMLPVLAASPAAFLVAFSVLAYDHFAFDLKQLLNRDLPLSNTAKLLVVSMVSATFAVVIAPIIVSNLASPMGTFFLVSLAAQVFDPVTMQSFSENPASGLFALSVGTVSNFSTYALSMGWAPMALLGFATSALLSNTRWLPSLSVAQNYLSAYRRLGEIRPLNTHSSIEDYESFLIDGPYSLLTRGRLARNLEIARHTSGVKSVFYLGAGTDLTHVLTSFPDATHVTLSGNNYVTITAESIKNAMATSHGLTGRSNELLTAYKESVSNNGFAGTSLVQNPVMQSSFLALELLSLGVQVGTIRSESGGGISFEVPGLLGRPSRRVSIIFKNNSFNGSPVRMNTGEQTYDGFFAKAIDGIQPYYSEIFSALADRLSSSLTVVSDRAVPDNMDDIGFREISKVTVSDEDSGSYGNAFQVVKLNRFPPPPQENELAAKSVVALIESRKLAKLAINLKYNFEGTDYRSTFELQGETSRNDIDSAIRILGAANVSVQVAEEYGRQMALAEGTGTQKVAVLHGIDSWEEKTRTIALAVVRGMLMAGKPVLIVAEEGFESGIINYSGETSIEVLNVAQLTPELMDTVESRRESKQVPLAATVLIREEDSAVLDGTNYSALTFEGISRAVQNALETLIATLRAA